MRVSSRTSYPYPIWCQNDDYKEKIQDKDIKINQAHNKDNYAFEFDFNNTNKDIDSLIENGEAVYECTAYCRETFTQFRVQSKTPTIAIEIPRNEVLGNVELQLDIIAVKEIRDFSSDKLNEDYKGRANFPLGAVIAEICVYKFNTIISDEQRSLDDAFAVVLNPDSNDIVYKMDSSKILILLPQKQLDAFNIVNGEYSSVMHATIVYQALLIALSKIHEYKDDEDKQWVSILSTGIEDVEDVENLEDLEDGKSYSIDDCMKIANHILQDPLKRTLDDLYDKSITENETH